MNKNTNKTIDEWRKVIERMGEEREKAGESLMPSRDETDNLVEFTHGLYRYAQRINMAHDMVRDKVVTVEVGQKIINVQKEMLNRNLNRIVNMMGAGDQV